MGYKQRYTPTKNFFVEGVGATTNTKDLTLDQLLGEHASTASQRLVKNFSDDGADISCHLHSNFTHKQLAWTSRTDITGFYDIDGHISTIEQGFADSSTNLEFLHVPGCSYIRGQSGYKTLNDLPNLHWYMDFPVLNRSENYILNNATSIQTLKLPLLTELWIQNSGRRAYYQMSGLLRLYMPSLTTVSYPFSNIAHFVNTKTGCVVYVDPALETSDGGLREPLIAYLEDIRLADIRYITSTVAPSAVSDLAVTNIAATTVDVTYTPPATTNKLEFYEVWINDSVTKYHPLFAHQEINASGVTIVGLTTATNYDITMYACDEFYNKSLVSNLINFNTL